LAFSLAQAFFISRKQGVVLGLALGLLTSHAPMPWRRFSTAPTHKKKSHPQQADGFSF
jgi:hypothetical protein